MYIKISKYQNLKEEEGGRKCYYFGFTHSPIDLEKEKKNSISYYYVSHILKRQRKFISISELLLSHIPTNLRENKKKRGENYLIQHNSWFHGLKKYQKFTIFSLPLGSTYRKNQREMKKNKQKCYYFGVISSIVDSKIGKNFMVNINFTFSIHGFKKKLQFQYYFGFYRLQEKITIFALFWALHTPPPSPKNGKFAILGLLPVSQNLKIRRKRIREKK